MIWCDEVEWFRCEARQENCFVLKDCGGSRVETVWEKQGNRFEDGIFRLFKNKMKTESDIDKLCSV